MRRKKPAGPPGEGRHPPSAGPAGPTGALTQHLGERGAVPLLVDLVGAAARLASPPAATTALAIPNGLPRKAVQVQARRRAPLRTRRAGPARASIRCLPPLPWRGQDCLLLLSLLCASNPPLQESFGEQGGISVVLPYLSPAQDTKLLLAAVDCLWSAVPPCAANVSRFVQRDGVLRLLECLRWWTGPRRPALFEDRAPSARLVAPKAQPPSTDSEAPPQQLASCAAARLQPRQREDCPAFNPPRCLAGCAFAPRAQLLSFSADVLGHGAAQEQAGEWRSRDHPSALALLLQLWAEEEARIGAAATKGGVLRSTERPLSVARTGLLQDFSASLRLEVEAGEEPDDDELQARLPPPAPRPGPRPPLPAPPPARRPPPRSTSARPRLL